MKSNTTFDRIKVPTLLVDEQKCRRNIRRMAEKARRSGVHFRPHFKTHQSAVIGEWFREEGVRSITVSSIGMARYFADAGWDDVTVAFPVNLREMEEILDLAGRIRLHLVANSTEVVKLLDKQMQHRVGIFVEIDTGYHRSGIPDRELSSVQQIMGECLGSRNLMFQGFLSHFGDTYEVTGSEAVKAIYLQGVHKLRDLREKVDTVGNCLISIGDTPSCSLVERFDEVDEIRPGNFVFYDVMQQSIGACTEDEIAVCLAAPVTDLYPERGEAVVYAGAVHLSKEKLLYKGEWIFGLVVELTADGWSAPLPGGTLTRISQEHGILKMPPEIMRTLERGSLIGILPVHSCLTANLMRQYTTLTGLSIAMNGGA